MRSAEELYDGEIKAPEPTDTTASDSRGETGNEPVVETKTEGEKPKVETKTTDEVAFEDDAEAKPVDLSGYERALDAARGDKRKARKLWQEAKAKLAEEVAKARSEAESAAYQRAVAQFAQQQRHQQQPQTTSPVVPDLNDTNFFDPDAVKAFVAHQVKSGVATVEQAWFQRNIAAAKERHTDFDEFEAEFKKAVATNPHLGVQADNAPDPAEFAYRTGKTLREMQGVGTIDEFRAKIAAEERAKILAEQVQQPPTTQSILQAPAIKPPLPKSLASVRGTGVGIKPEWSPHTAEQLYDS